MPFRVNPEQAPVFRMGSRRGDLKRSQKGWSVSSIPPILQTRLSRLFGLFGLCRDVKGVDLKSKSGSILPSKNKFLQSLQLTHSKLHMGSLPLPPAGLLGPLPGLMSENYVFQVTLHTSLQLRGRTAELPWSDFNRQVICHARHTVRYRTEEIELLRGVPLHEAGKIGTKLLLTGGCPPNSIVRR